MSVHEDDVRSTQTQLLTSQIINHIIYISILCRFVDILEWCKIKLDIRMKLADLWTFSMVDLMCPFVLLMVFVQWTKYSSSSSTRHETHYRCATNGKNDNTTHLANAAWTENGFSLVLCFTLCVGQSDNKRGPSCQEYGVVKHGKDKESIKSSILTLSVSGCVYQKSE